MLPSCAAATGPSVVSNIRLKLRGGVKDPATPGDKHSGTAAHGSTEQHEATR